MCWSTNTRTPTRPSTNCSSCWSASAAASPRSGDDDQSIYGWRGATLDNLEETAAGFPRAARDQARAELPLDQRHPARGQQRDRPQPKLFPKTLWEQRLGEGEPVRVTAATTRDHGPSAQWRASRACAPTTSARTSRTSPSATAPTTRRAFGNGAAPRTDPHVQRSRGAQSFSTAPRSGPVRLAAPAGQQRRRPGLPARDHDAQARHRPPDAGPARRLRDAVQAQPVRVAVLAFARCDGQRARARRPTSSAATSTTWSTARAIPAAPRRRKAFLKRLAQGHRHEQYLYDSEDSRRRPPLAGAT